MRWDAGKTVRVLVVVVLSAGYVEAQERSPAPSASPSPAPAAKPGGRVKGTNDQRRTVRGYPSILLYNFMGVVTPGNYPILAAGAVLTAPAFLLDDEVDDYFVRHPHDNWGKIGKNIGGSLSVAGLTIGFFSAG